MWGTGEGRLYLSAGDWVCGIGEGRYTSVCGCMYVLNGVCGVFDTVCLSVPFPQCYTTVGLELARVTVVDMHCNTVYDSLVLPSHPIVDYNTRFSGLTAHDFTNDINTSLTDVQAKLMTMVSMETILLGHSLDSDLRALKVCQLMM